MQKLARHILLGSLFLILCFSAQAQIVFYESDVAPFTPERMIEKVLIAGGVEINTINYFGDTKSIGVFNHAQQYIGIKQGIIMSTGLAASAATINGSQYSGAQTSGQEFEDEDLAALTPGNQISDISKYEINFTPNTDKILFRYVFASEEYPESVCTDFNDVFGFFISGPDPNGGDYQAKNIALVPDPNDPSGQSFLNYAVSINSINPGSAGSNGDPVFCSDALGGSLNFSQYYNSTSNNTFPVYDGYSDVFYAVANVIPCENYTIKLAIADAFDDDFDSAVFLEAKSFGNTTLLAEVITPGLDRVIAEGCGTAEVRFTLPDNVDADTPIDINVIQDVAFESPADENIDFEGIDRNLVIPAGTNTVSMVLSAMEDNLSEGIEYIYIDYQLDICTRDTIRIAITDNIMPDITVLDERTICQGNQVRLFAQFPNDFEPASFTRYTNNDILNIDQDSTLFESTINVKNRLPELLAPNVISKICIDTLTHTFLNSLDIYLETPGGQLIELSTSNGQRPDNELQVDTFLNTCFTINGTRDIHLGNTLEGMMDLNNPGYTGNFIPEGRWEDIYLNTLQPANGDYKLLIFNHAPADIGVLKSWSIVFSPSYGLEYQWFENENPIPCTQSCEEIFQTPVDTTDYILEVRDSYGCTLRDTTQVNFNFVPLTPTGISCEVLSPTELRICWDQVENVERYGISYIGLAEYYYVDETQNCFILIGLIPNRTYTIQVRAFNQDCSSGNGTTTCETIPCTGANPRIDSISIIEPSCFGGDDGMIQIFGSDENENYQYHLNTNENDNGIFTNLSSDNYYIRLINENNCGVDTTIFLSEPTALALDFQVVPVRCKDESSGALTAVATGDHPPFDFLWEDGTDISLNDNLPAGTYSCTVTDSKDCTAKAKFTLENPPEFFIESYNIFDASCFTSTDGGIEVNVVGGVPNYTFEWSDSTQNSTPNLTNISGGNYSVTVYDSNSCSREEQFIVESAAEIIIDISFPFLDCSNTIGSTVRATATNGVAPYSYEWSNGNTGPLAMNVLEGQIELLVTDDSNCTQLLVVDVSPSAAFGISFEKSDLNCPSDLDGSIQILIDGVVSNDYTYDWESGESSSMISGLGIGDYCVTITDDEDCSLDTCITIISSDLFEINLEAINHVTCFNDQNGSINTSISGVGAPFVSIWSNGESGESISNLPAGDFEISVTNANNCTSVQRFTITQPEPLGFSEEIKNISCVTDTDGRIEIAATGGTAPYSYEWDTGSQDSIISDLLIGDYSFTITDANNCQLVETLRIKGPSQALFLNVDIIGASCEKVFDGVITASASGGTAPYSFSLNNTGFTANNVFQNLQTGSYLIQVKDDSDCIISQSNVIVDSPDPLIVDLGSDTTVFLGSRLEIIPNIINGGNELIYDWNIQGLDRLDCVDCENNAIDSVLHSNIISLKVLDENGCAAEDFLIIYINTGKRDDVKVPTGFSPNNDGSNDRLAVYGLEDIKINMFRVYSRWGDLVFESQSVEVNDESTGWDGLYHSDELPSGVYHWIMEFEDNTGKVLLKKGNTTLIR